MSPLRGRLVLLTGGALLAGAGLFMSDKAEFAAVDLTGVHVGDQLDLSGSKVTGTLDMSSVQVGGGLFMRDKYRPSPNPPLFLQR